ncbi:MAG: hypothetical protein Q8Q60_01260 [Candidatus Chromulinivorax sp.]|nr:hypothetical protein [Candidatus Chromulinivorax sp.]
MNFKKTTITILICLSFNVLQGSSPKEQPEKTIAELAESLIDTAEKVRACESVIERETSLQEIKYLEAENLDDFEELSSIDNQDLITALKNFEAVRDAVDRYLQSEKSSPISQKKSQVMSEQIEDIEN